MTVALPRPSVRPLCLIVPMIGSVTFVTARADRVRPTDPTRRPVWASSPPPGDAALNHEVRMWRAKERNPLLTNDDVAVLIP